MTTVSVVVPAYNSAETLSRALESAVAQTLENNEVIVVNDGSSDRTAAVASQYEDEIILIEHDQNLGGSAARNTGIQYATGQYVAFLDADDEWESTKLAKQIELLESRSEKWVAAYCDYVPIRSGLTRVLRSFLSNSAEFPKEGGEELIPYVFTTQFSLGGASTLVVRRSVIESIGGFDESFERHQDWELLVRLLQTGNLAYVEEELVKKHASGSPAPKTLKQAQKQYFKKFEQEIKEMESLGYDISDVHSFRIAIAYCRAGKFYRGIQEVPKTQLKEVDNLGRFLWGISIGMRNRWG